MAVHLSIDRFEAVIFDLDGVVTDTASVHRAAWKELFDDELRRRAGGGDSGFEPFTDDDYRRYVDGRPRYDGVRAFLASRGITLPEGTPDDPPEARTVCGLGNTKDAMFHRRLDDDGVAVFESTVQLIEDLRSAGVHTAIVSASRNGREVLEAAGLLGHFDVRVDGEVAGDLGLAGKPDPAVFLEAARRLDVSPSRAAVVEDALAGVEAGRAGGFGLVIGVDRTGHADDLRRHGADVVVEDLAEVVLESATGTTVS